VSEHFADSAARLAGLVPLLLGWPPDAFWNATPAELAAVLAPGAAGAPVPLSRGELDRLMERERNGRQ
jgi:uncharacterized phage protein (TIGR02216 family)